MALRALLHLAWAAIFSAGIALADTTTPANQLIQQLFQGQGASYQAANMLAQSGQESVLPQLEKAIFLKPEDEPKAPPSAQATDVIFESVSRYALQAFVTIVQKSPKFSPRLKSWMEFFKDGSGVGWYGEEDDKMKILREWWNANRADLAAGNYDELQIVPLWPSAGGGRNSMQDSFEKNDYLAALQSPYGAVREFALGWIQNSAYARDLPQADLEKVDACLNVRNSRVHALGTFLLGENGEAGLLLLRKELDNSDPEIRGDAGSVLLSVYTTPLNDRLKSLLAIVQCDNVSYVANSPMFGLELFPLFKAKVLDDKLPDKERTGAAYYFCSFARHEDLPQLKQIVLGKFPDGVRCYALGAICRFYPEGEPPAIVKENVNDAVLGPWITQQGFLSKPAPFFKSIREIDHEHLDLGDEEILKLYSNFITKREFGGGTLIVQSGRRGIALLKAALAFPSDGVRGAAAETLLDYGDESVAERSEYLSAAMDGLADEDRSVAAYLYGHEELAGDLMPLLKKRVFDPKATDRQRMSAALLLANWSRMNDNPFLERMLASRLPDSVRALAIHALCRHEPDNPPASVAKLAGDPVFGTLVRTYGYLR